MKKKDLLFLTISLLLIAFFASIVYPKQVYSRLSFFWTNNYLVPIYISLIIAFIILFLNLFKKIDLNKMTPKLKVIYGILFLPLALFPAMRCYFKIPYIFCKICPRKCFWGEITPVIIPSFIFLNLDKRFWCYKLCPFGTLQEYQCKVIKKRICLPKWLQHIRWLFLILTIAIILLSFYAKDSLQWFFRGTHHFYIWVTIISLIIFLLAFFIPRFWCNYFCPIGSCGDLMLKVEGKIK